ncbi:MAG TPA: isoprenylcysteine carboxylmethyltransferase family protein [Ignavibacteriaceae bacterium]
MDPINIIILMNIAATFGANISGAKKGLKSKVAAIREKPKSFLQKFPLVLSTTTLIVLILGTFQIGTLEYLKEHNAIRLIGLPVYLIFSWVQVWSFKALGDSYSQDIVIKKDHKLVSSGPFRFIRHPQYFSQILINIGGTAATLSFVLGALTLIEIPVYIMRALMEDKLLSKHFKEEFSAYKKKSGFMIPFIG